MAVLTLTADEAIHVGLASSVTTSTTDFGEALGIQRWRAAPFQGRTIPYYVRYRYALDMILPALEGFAKGSGPRSVQAGNGLYIISEYDNLNPRDVKQISLRLNRQFQRAESLDPEMRDDLKAVASDAQFEGIKRKRMRDARRAWLKIGQTVRKCEKQHDGWQLNVLHELLLEDLEALWADYFDRISSRESP